MGVRLQHYDVLHLLGAGGMAEVHLARHRELGTLRAIKRIKDRNPRLIARLRAEGELQRSLRHPNVVGVIEVTEAEDGDPVLVLEYVDGPTLADLLGARVQLAPTEIDALGCGILDGMVAAHGRDWVHRDLKPSNVLLAVVGDQLVPRVADFGLAKALDPEAPLAAGATTRRGLGTQRYMPLEQLLGAAADKRMDVFALGAVLFELVEGRPAFPTVTDWEHAIRADEAPTPTRADAPERFARAIAAALAPLADRPVDAAALRALWGERRATAPFRAEILDLARAVTRHLPDARLSAADRSEEEEAHLSICARCRRASVERLETLAPSTLAPSDLAGDDHAAAVWLVSTDPDDPRPLRFGGARAGGAAWFERPRDAARCAASCAADGLGAALSIDPTRAGWLAAIAAPGQVFADGPAVALLAAGGWADGAPLGRWRFAGDVHPVELFELGVADAALRPPNDGPGVWQVVSRNGSWVPARAIDCALPPETDRFIGRDADLVALAAAVAQHRVVVVHGPAGVGKTRLALRFAREWLGAWPGGAWFCDLSDARTVRDAAQAIARALGAQLDAAAGHDAFRPLQAAIAARGRCLLVLDNLEQLADAADPLVRACVDAGDQAAFLVTSRVRGGVRGEVVFPLEPLPADAGFALFADRAAAVRRGFDAEADRHAVEALVARLDGLPLAIELCAARARAMQPGQMLARLDERFRLLAGAPDGPSERHQTLRAALDWSWALLAPAEREALVRLTAFEDGFTLEAAEAVLDNGGQDWAADLVQSLVDRALVRRVGDHRFGLLVSVHAYAVERGDPETLADAAVRHGAWFAGFGEDGALDALSRTGGVERLRALTDDLQNLVAAARRAEARGAIEMAAANALAAWSVLTLTGPVATGAALLDAVAGRSARPRVTLAAATARLRCGDVVGATALAERAREAAHRVGDLQVAGRATNALALALTAGGRSRDARAHIDEAIALARASGDRGGEGDALADLALWCSYRGDNDEARDHYTQAIAIHRERGDRHGEAIALGNLGHVLRLGDRAAARACFERALAIHRDVGDRRFQGFVLGYLGRIARDDGRMDEALAHYELAVQIQARLGQDPDATVLCGLGALHDAQGRAEQALDCLRRGLAVARRQGDARHEALARTNLGAVLSRTGGVAEARANYHHASALYRQIGDRRNLAAALVNLGIVDRDASVFEEALGLYREVGDKVGEALTLGNLGHLLLERGQVTEAVLVLGSAVALAGEHGAGRVEAVSLGWYGAALSAAGRHGEAGEAFTRSVAALRALADPVHLAEVLVASATASISSGDLDAARAALREAESLDRSAIDSHADVGKALEAARSQLDAASEATSGPVTARRPP